MTVPRPPGLRVGDEILVDGAAHTVTGLSGSHARFVDVTGVESRVVLAELLCAPGFCVVTRAPAALPPRGLLDSLPVDAVDQARWWECHIVEVLAGVPPEAGQGARPRPEYDPATRTLRQRELAKVGELAEDGHTVPLSTFQRLRLAYEKPRCLGFGRSPGHLRAGCPDRRACPAGDRSGRGRGDEPIDRDSRPAAAARGADPGQPARD